MFFFRSSLQLDINAGSRREYSSGLIPLFFAFKSRRAKSFPISLVARIAGLDTVPPVRLEFTAGSQLYSSWLGFVSHLVPDGTWDVVLEGFDSRGRKVGFAKTAVTFSNPGTLAEQVRTALIARQTPVFFPYPADSKSFGATDPSLAPWYDQEGAADHIDRRLAAGEIDAAMAGQFHQFVRDGYVILDATIQTQAIDRLNADLTKAIDKGYGGYQPGSSNRIELLHFEYQSAMDMLYQAPVTRFLTQLWGADPRPCQCLVFACGSQQDPHQDTIHLTSFPDGYMCGVWIALEDIQPDSGELVVYPGSHRLPQVRMADVDCNKVVDGDWTEFGAKVLPVWQAGVDQCAIEPVIYRPKKGQILVWHANLMHGGSQRRNLSLSRRSMVIHYFAGGCLNYYDSSGQIGTQLAARTL
jgi:hypothetical protein